MLCHFTLPSRLYVLASGRKSTWILGNLLTVIVLIKIIEKCLIGVGFRNPKETERWNERKKRRNREKEKRKQYNRKKEIKLGREWSKEQEEIQFRKRDKEE